MDNKEYHMAMNQNDRDELLIRVDQKVINIEKLLFDKPKYSTIKEKVLSHDRAFWIALTASIVAVVRSFWSI